MKHWWGEYTIDLMREGWLDNGDEPPYRVIGQNGKWEIIKFYTDAAIYSYCTKCGFTHSCYKGDLNFGYVYAFEKEYNYCPKCGEYMERMEIEGDDKR